MPELDFRLRYGRLRKQRAGQPGQQLDYWFHDVPPWVDGCVNTGLGCCGCRLVMSSYAAFSG
jgi:hypothetical protein